MAAEANFDVGTIKRNPRNISFVGRKNSNSARSVVCCQFHFLSVTILLVTMTSQRKDFTTINAQ
jgi:hypothetical protein